MTVMAPTCSVCGGQMRVGQKGRHFVCSPPLECCGYPVDLVVGQVGQAGALEKHRKAHAG